MLRPVVLFGRRHGTSLPPISLYRQHESGWTLFLQQRHRSGSYKRDAERGGRCSTRILRRIFLCFDKNPMPRRDEARIGFSARMATLTRDGSPSREIVMAGPRLQNHQDPQMRRSQNDSALGHLPSLKYLQDTSGGDEFALAETFGT